MSASHQTRSWICWLAAVRPVHPWPGADRLLLDNIRQADIRSYRQVDVPFHRASLNIRVERQACGLRQPFYWRHGGWLGGSATARSSRSSPCSCRSALPPPHELETMRVLATSSRGPVQPVSQPTALPERSTKLMTVHSTACAGPIGGPATSVRSMPAASPTQAPRMRSAPAASAPSPESMTSLPNTTTWRSRAQEMLAVETAVPMRPPFRSNSAAAASTASPSRQQWATGTTTPMASPRLGNRKPYSWSPPASTPTAAAASTTATPRRTTATPAMGTWTR